MFQIGLSGGVWFEGPKVDDQVDNTAVSLTVPHSAFPQQPLCKCEVSVSLRLFVQGKLAGWIAKWRPERKFPIDMGGMAVHVKELLARPSLKFNDKGTLPQDNGERWACVVVGRHDEALCVIGQRGMLETEFLERIVSPHDVEVLLTDYSEVLVRTSSVVSTSVVCPAPSDNATTCAHALLLAPPHRFGTREQRRPT